MSNAECRSCRWSGGQCLGKCFNEEEFAPHDRFVDAQAFVDVVDAALEDAFPVFVVGGEVGGLAESGDGAKGKLTVGDGEGWTGGEFREREEATGGDGGGGGVGLGARKLAVGGGVVVPGRNAVV